LNPLPEADRQHLYALVSAGNDAFEICGIARNANCESHRCLYHQPAKARDDLMECSAALRLVGCRRFVDIADVRF
jgi:hypothetical protein